MRMRYGTGELTNMAKMAKTKRELCNVAMLFALERSDFICAFGNHPAVEAHHVFGRGALFYADPDWMLPLCRKRHTLAEQGDVETLTMIKHYYGEELYDYMARRKKAYCKWNFLQAQEDLIRKIEKSGITHTLLGQSCLF